MKTAIAEQCHSNQNPAVCELPIIPEVGKIQIDIAISPKPMSIEGGIDIFGVDRMVGLDCHFNLKSCLLQSLKNA